MKPLTEEQIKRAKEIGALNAKRIAEELVSVQPMPNDMMKRLMESAITEEEAKEQGLVRGCTGLFYVQPK